jgi:uncharacterized protein YndB with AHSA1/START domain
MTVRTDDVSAVCREVSVPVPPDRAFAVFTDGIDRWWLRAHHVQPGTLRRVGIDPEVGGRVWEENDAGAVCVWGRVLAWEPPHRFAFSWQIGTDWAVPAPDAPASRVTVTFTAAEGGTRVQLVHDRLDAHGPGWEQLRESVGSDGGWPALLSRFADAV